MSVFHHFRFTRMGLLLAVLMAGCFAQVPPSVTAPKKITKPKVKTSASPSALPVPSASPSASAGPTQAPSSMPSPSPSPISSTSPSASPSLVVSTFAGGTQGWAEGIGETARFDSPNGLDVDANGNIYVADAGNHAVRKVTAGGAVSTLAGGTEGAANGVGASAQFKTPYGLAVDANGNVFVADTGNHVIRKITPGGEVSTFAGDGTPGARDSTEGTPQFKNPFSLDLDTEGNLIVADAGNHRIRKVTPDGRVTTLAGGEAGYVDGLIADARFFVPNDVAIRDDGSILVADYSNHCIRQISPSTGRVSTVAGNGVAGKRNGKSTDAQFNSPTGIVIGRKGNIFVADNLNHLIRQITVSGEVKTYAGDIQGTKDGAVEQARFKGPTDVVMDANGNLYVADTDNHRIRKIR